MNTQSLTTPSFWRSILIMVAVALLAAALVACGGDSAPETEPTVAVEAPPPVDDESAEEPAEQPTAEPVEQPTDEPAEDPTTEPTAAPTEAAEEPTEEAAAETSSGQLLMGGDCTNSFYPVSEGLTLRYTSLVDDMGQADYSLSFSDVSDTTFTVVTEYAGETIVTTTWTCTPEGLLAPEFTQGPGLSEGMTVEFVEATGQSIPTEDKFQPGETWTARYVANVTMPDLGTGMTGFVETFEIFNESVAIEAVSVPAGDYPDAVRVETTIAILLTPTGDGGQEAANIEMTSTAWYVEGIGMVKQVSDGIMGFGASTTELVAIEE